MAMATFVIVHGAWGGGWEWTEVAQGLRARGHEVFTPTLTGLGERAHLGGPDVDLSTHIQDVVGVLEFEDLRDVVLCAHSYGGLPVTGAADRVPERVARVVYLDAFLPRDGEAAMDFIPPEQADALREAEASGEEGWWRMPIPPVMLPPKDGIDPDRRARFVERLTDQSAPATLEPLALTGAVDKLPRAFVRCTGSHFEEDMDPMAPFAQRAKDDGLTYRELATPHRLHLFDPEGTVEVLDDLARLDG